MRLNLKGGEKMKELKFYTLNEVAEGLKVTKRALYNFLDDGSLKAVKVGRVWRVSEENLQEFLSKGTK